MNPIQQEMNRIAGSLREAALAHQENRLADVSKLYHAAYSEYTQNRIDPAFKRGLDRSAEKLLDMVWLFWESWSYGVDHNFRLRYEGITVAQWPVLARYLATHLETREPVREWVLLRHFGDGYAEDSQAREKTVWPTRAFLGSVGVILGIALITSYNVGFTIEVALVGLTVFGVGYCIVYWLVGVEGHVMTVVQLSAS